MTPKTSVLLSLEEILSDPALRNIVPEDLETLFGLFPRLERANKLVLEKAVDEFQERQRHGEAPSPQSFARRFSACGSEVAQQLLAEEYIDANLALLEPKVQPAPPTAAGPLWPVEGDRIAGFNLKRELGRGSFARVFLAEESDLGKRPVALKISLAGRDKPDPVAEAETLARLRHDNIVPIYSIRKVPGTDFTVVCMPYLGRTTLQEVLRFVYCGRREKSHAQVILDAARLAPGDEEIVDSPRPTTLRTRSYLDGVIGLGIEMAEALAFVHAHNTFHRDLKPSNVLIRPDGKPMLLDFNLSFEEGRRGRQVLGGTPLYMSPEQLRATANDTDHGPHLLDARSDIYSLGVILYELLGGDHPFICWETAVGRLGEEEIRALLRPRQAAGPRPLRRANPLVDKRLAGVVEKCMAPRRGDRFASANELALALRECLAPAQRVRRWLVRRTRAMVVAAAVGLAAAALLAAASIMRPSYQERQFQQGVEALKAGRYVQAVACFDRALSEEKSFRFHMARARACQKLGKYHEAAADFKLADALEPSGHTKACIAYCFSQLDTPAYHAGAVAYYREALRKGYDSAVIHNNMGFSLMQRRGHEVDAGRCFRAAVKAAPTYQMAHFNLVDSELRSASYRKSKVTREGLAALDKAFQTGPVGATLHHAAARFYALSKHLHPCWRELAISHLQQAIQLGAQPAVLQTDLFFDSLRHDPAFTQLTSLTPGNQPATGELRQTQDPFISITP